MGFDQTLFSYINGLAGKGGVLDFLGIFLADYLWYFLIIAVLVIVFRLKSWKERIYYFSFVALTAILARGIISETIRFFYHRPRPFMVSDVNLLINHSNNGAFPSGHTTLVFAVILPIFYINERLAWYLTSGAVLVGLARVYCGVHWPTDILGGMAVAVIGFYAIDYLFKKTGVKAK